MQRGRSMALHYAFGKCDSTACGRANKGMLYVVKTASDICDVLAVSAACRRLPR